MPNCFEKAEPLPKPTTMDEQFEWQSAQQGAFEIKITTFTTAPAVHHLEYQTKVIVAIGDAD
jgi:hypothetical protein